MGPRFTDTGWDGGTGALPRLPSFSFLPQRRGFPIWGATDSRAHQPSNRPARLQACPAPHPTACLPRQGANISCLNKDKASSRKVTAELAPEPSPASGPSPGAAQPRYLPRAALESGHPPLPSPCQAPDKEPGAGIPGSCICLWGLASHELASRLSPRPGPENHREWPTQSHAWQVSGWVPGAFPHT